MKAVGNFSEAFDISDAFGTAIEQVKRVPGPAFLGGFLTMCTEGSNSNFDLPDPTMDYGPWATMVMTFVFGVGFLIAAVQFFLAPLFEAGFIVVQRELLEGSEPEPSSLFTTRQFYGRLLGWNFCWLAVMLIAALPMAGYTYYVWMGDFEWAQHSEYAFLLQAWWELLVAFGVWAITVLPVLAFLWLSFCLTSRLVVCEDLPLFEAARASWQLTHGHRLALIPFALIGFLFRLGGVLLGLLLCCVGILVTYPFAIAVREVAWTRAYLWYVQGDPSQRAQRRAEVFS